MLASPALSIITRFTFPNTNKDKGIEEEEEEENAYNDQQVDSSDLLELAYLSPASASCTCTIPSKDDHSGLFYSMMPTPSTERANSSYLISNRGGSGGHFSTSSYNARSSTTSKQDDHDPQCFEKLDETEVDELQRMVWELWRDFNSSFTPEDMDPAICM